eukprot:TRINITY_DN3200_c2_g3_i1.p1 TRINITY_DN3200_c2_g3~~TRINITY_DN3200_c2_g3_i1.p1  ORF type:complete len:291 (+),score=17.35 TRINITY_DN3200_c2_g3_i1:73-945(+)
MSRIPLSLAYNQVSKGTRGAWQNTLFHKKEAHESFEEFTMRKKPSHWTQADGNNGLLVANNDDYQLPEMPQYLYQTMMKSTYAVTSTPKVNQNQSTGWYVREGFASSKSGLQASYEKAMEKENLKQGMFLWSCPLPKNKEEAAEVDEDWERLTEAYSSGSLGPHVESIFVRGPFPIKYMKPAVAVPTRSNSEEYQFYVLTSDYDNVEALNDVHWKLRQLSTTSNKGRWFNYHPLYAKYLRWNQPRYHCPPTGGDLLTPKELLKWITTGRTNPFPTSLGSEGRFRVGKLIP